MSNVINFNEFKSKKSRVNDLNVADKFFRDLAKNNYNALEFDLVEKVLDLVDLYERVDVRFNFTQVAKELNTTVYKVKKAYKNLLDNKVLIEVSKEKGKPVLVSSKNLILVCNFTDYIQAYL